MAAEWQQSSEVFSVKNQSGEFLTGEQLATTEKIISSTMKRG